MPQPAIYYIATNEAISQLRLLLESEEAPVGVKSFVDTIIELQIVNKHNPVARSVVLNHLKKSKSKGGSSGATLTIREKEFQKLGIMEESEDVIDKKKVIIKKLKKLTPLLSAPKRLAADKSNRKSFSKRQIRLALDEINFNENIAALSADGPWTSRIDALFTGVLDAMVRISGKDKRNFIAGTLQYASETVEITTQTLSSSQAEIIQLSDYRVVRAIDEMYVNYVEENHGPLKKLSTEQKSRIPVDLVFDIYDLCEKLGWERGKNTADQARKILDRLASTEFHINASEAPKFREKFTAGATSQRVRYLSEFRTYDEWEENEDTNIVDLAPRLYLVRLHSSIASNIVNNELRHIAHPGLIQDNSGIAHRFNNWCKVIIGVTAGKNDKVKEFLLDELWEQVMPSSRLSNFSESFKSLLRREALDGPESWRPGENCISLIYGYYVEIIHDEHEVKEVMRVKERSTRSGGKMYPLLRIWRDKADEYVGDNSDHNQALRRVYLA